MIRSREDIPTLARRIVIKAGTSVVTADDGYVSISHISNIVERAARLFLEGKQVLFVSSGAVNVGRQALKKRSVLGRSLFDMLSPAKTGDDDEHSVAGVPSDTSKAAYNSACAATGQLGLMSLYEVLFRQFDITVAQILVTSSDFHSPERRRNIQYVLTQLLNKGVLPLLNENDPVSLNQGYATFGQGFSDNDALASMVSIEMNAQLLILLTDVKGVYDKPPKEGGAIIHDFDTATLFQEGDKSSVGRGGMGAKVDAAKKAIEGGVNAVVIARGQDFDVIDQITKGERVGTLFLSNPLHQFGPASLNTAPSQISVDGAQRGGSTDVAVNIQQIAEDARLGSRQLQALSPEQRTSILLAIATALEERVDMILQTNRLDIEAAELAEVAPSLLNRLKMTEEKMGTLVQGIRSIANQDDPLDALLEQSELADCLVLDKIRTPIGVLLIIFESRPDCLPQIAALAIRSGNGIILKGGKEAEQSNLLLHSIIAECIAKETNGNVAPGVIGLVTTRADIKSLLQLDKYIDLVIPRGSNDLVKYIKNNTTGSEGKDPQGKR
jgi:delta-1-pyrroline-5-carboxylate synthetase